MSYALFRLKKIWHYRFQVGNARVQRSTREKTKARAEPVAQRAWDEALALTNGGHAVPKLAALVQEWQLVHAPVTSAAHQRSVDQFFRLHLYELGELPVSLITTTHVELARNLHLATHKPASANHWLRVLKLVVNWAVKRGIIPRLPWSVKILKVQKRPRSILPMDKAMPWLTAVDNACICTPGIAMAIRLMLGLGLRESESAGARWEWIDWERATYTPGITKGREAEPIPMAQWVVDHLMPLRAPEGFISPNDRGGQYRAGFARKAINAANLACDTKGITPHRLRGTFATWLSEAGVPIQIVQRLLRHKSAMTTMAYLEKNLDIAVIALGGIAKKIGFVWRESGETPHASA